MQIYITLLALVIGLAAFIVAKKIESVRYLKPWEGIPLKIIILICVVIFGIGTLEVVYEASGLPDLADQTPTPTIGPGYGWSCIPVNASNATGEVLCRPVNLTGVGI